MDNEALHNNCGYVRAPHIVDQVLQIWLVGEPCVPGDAHLCVV